MPRPMPRAPPVITATRPRRGLVWAGAIRRESSRRSRRLLGSGSQALERGLGLGHHALDHLGRGHNLADEPRALAAGGVAAFDVALLTGPYGRGESHALSLQREGQDLGGALLPLAGEIVADGAA